jgi:hypothetical protein
VTFDAANWRSANHALVELEVADERNPAGWTSPIRSYSLSATIRGGRTGMDGQTNEIAIETDSAELAREIAEAVDGATPVSGERKGLDGATLTTVLVTLTPFAIREIVRLATAHIAAKRHVRFVKDGVTIQGVSEATLLKILEEGETKKLP